MTTDVEAFRQMVDDDKFTRKQCPLSDGRILSYSESGCIDGKPAVIDDDDSAVVVPVLFHVGLMVSSLVVAAFHSQALQHNLRIVAVDYPGIGDSTPLPDRDVVHDWPNDVGEFVNAIFGRHAQFAVACHSMGGPHAYAVLFHPTLQPLILSATLVSPWLPFEDDNNVDNDQDGGGSNSNNNNNNKWFLTAARKLPDFVSHSIVPRLVTGTASMSMTMLGSVPTSSLDPNMAIAKEITAYASKQGQAGNQQMVHLAISTKLPTTIADSEVDPIPVHVFWGTKDTLISESTCQFFVDSVLQRRRSKTHQANAHSSNDDRQSLRRVEGADHNSIMSEEYLPMIFETLSATKKKAPQQAS